MHDFFLAKEIIDELHKIIEEKKLSKIKSVNLEIGAISLAHDGHDLHEEEINLENLEFNLKSLAQKTAMEKAIFNIRKTAGDYWKITDIEV